MSWMETTREDFHRARRKALLRHLSALLNRRSNDLLPFEEVRARLHVRSQHYLGHKTVRIANIIGSEGRYEDFDRHFHPRHNATQMRWMSIDRAHIECVNLPSIDLYKVGDVYFVKDGHHRISVARHQGQLEIDAIVTELIVDVPLSIDLSLRDLMLKEEYSDFLTWTRLAELRPEQQIEFSEPGGYLDLIRHINGHRYYMGLELDRPIEADEAVVNWYDSVYLPVVEVLREQQSLRFFPKRTEADLYRWVMDHRWYLRERNGGADPGPLTATSDYVKLFGRFSLTHFTQQLMRGLFPEASLDMR